MTHKYGFFLILSQHILVFLGAFLGGIWNWLVPILFIISPLFEKLDVRYVYNFSPEERQINEGSKIFDVVLLIGAALQIFFVGWACWYQSIISSDFLNWAGFLIGVGISGGFSIINSHELIHRKNKVFSNLGGVALSTVLFSSFKIEHLRGHHVDVCTEKDASSAKLNQSYYSMLRRALPENFIKAFKLEEKRLNNKGIKPFSIYNELIILTLLSIIQVFFYAAFFGKLSVVFFIIQAAIAICLLELVNYVEHYGLQRKKGEDGRYEAVSAKHAWNSPFLFSNLFMVNLQRHVDHHMNPTKKYQILNHIEKAPQLPRGYGTMLFVALFPGIWRSTINPIIKEYVDADRNREENIPRRQ